MTTPSERTRALVQTRGFLQRLATLGDDAVPISLLMEAEELLHHYPSLTQIELARKALPMFFGPVMPVAGTADIPADAAEAWWHQETDMLQILRTNALIAAEATKQRSQANERHLNWLIGICTGGMLVCLAVAVYAMKYLK